MDAKDQSAGDNEQDQMPGAGNAKRSPGEIGGKRFRVGLDDSYVPFRKRTKRRRKTIAMVVGGLLILGVGAYGLVNLVTAPGTATAAACKPAAQPRSDVIQAQAPGSQAAAGSTAAAAKFTLNIYNSTTRQGLAAATAKQLKLRGFVIGQVTNDPLKANLTVSAQVRGAKAQNAELHEVAAEVPGAQIQPDGRTDPSVDLVLGAGFANLATTGQVDATLQALATANGASSASGSGPNACTR